MEDLPDLPSRKVLPLATEGWPARFIVKIVDGSDALAAQQSKDLIKEYRNALVALGEDLDIATYPSYHQDTTDLPAKYSPEYYGLFLVVQDKGDEETAKTEEPKAVGCMALKRFDATHCEIKRLYVKPEYRGHRIGELLSKQLIAQAAAYGYKGVYLDTYERLPVAIKLYERLGFARCAAYCENHFKDVVYMSLALK